MIGLVDLRLTRPPDGLKQLKPKAVDFRDSLKPALISELANEKVIESPPKPPKERRAMPGNKRKEKESELFPRGMDQPKRSDVMFGDITDEEMERLQGMLINFCKVDDGSFLDDINLAQYSKDSGQAISNTVVQELCTSKHCL